MADKDLRPIPTLKEPDEFRDKLLSLPDFVQNWICSIESAKNNEGIAKKFKLSDEQIPLFITIAGDIILKNNFLEALPSRLQQGLSLNQDVAKQMSIEIATKQFLAIKDYLKDVEHFITSMGGTVPKEIPELKSDSSFSNGMSPQAPPVIAKQPFRQAVRDNKEILNQLLTENPIKIADFELPVRSSIKNWLSDYVKQNGAGHHDELVRSDYLFKNDNAKKLNESERLKLAEILKAYDDDAEVPLSDSKLIDLERLIKAEPAEAAGLPQDQTAPKIETAPKQTAPPLPPKTPLPPPPLPPKPARIGPDAYREPVGKEDLAGPIKKPESKPLEPKIEGNVINLKPEPEIEPENSDLPARPKPILLKSELPEAEQKKYEQLFSSGPQKPAQSVDSPKAKISVSPSFGKLDFPEQNGEAANLSSSFAQPKPDAYRETVEKSDLAGPMDKPEPPITPKAAPATPKIEGNTIDLKNLTDDHR